MSAILSRVEAARYLDISTDTLDRLRASGAIVASQVSRRLVKYRRDDLDAYVSQCQSVSSASRPTVEIMTCAPLALMDRPTYAIGDIHGRLDLLEKAADAIEADLAGRSGRVVCLGDYVDRGPDSRGVVEFLMRAQRDGACICLKGNHEDMMLQALEPGGPLGWWIGNGGGATLASYGGEVPKEHLDWMRSLPTHAELAGRIFVHAGLFPGRPIGEQDDESMMWIRDRFLFADQEFAGWPHIVHGHTPVHQWKDVASAELLDWRTNLDTGAYHTGVLTIGVFEGDAGPPARLIQVAA